MLNYINTVEWHDASKENPKKDSKHILAAFQYLENTFRYEVVYFQKKPDNNAIYDNEYITSNDRNIFFTIEPYSGHYCICRPTFWAYINPPQKSKKYCVDCNCCRKGFFKSKPDRYVCIGVPEPFIIENINAPCTEYK